MNIITAVSLNFEERLLGAYIFGGALLIFIIVSVFILIKNIRRGRLYENESLPTLADLNLVPYEEDTPVIDTEDEGSAFSLLDVDDEQGDEEADSLLREANIATRSATKETKKKRGLFKRK